MLGLANKKDATTLNGKVAVETIYVKGRFVIVPSSLLGLSLPLTLSPCLSFSSSFLPELHGVPSRL